jgi:hypothetical protein
MSPARNIYNPIIVRLLKEHDSTPDDQIELRNSIKRRILFLMSTVKSFELASA